MRSSASEAPIAPRAKQATPPASSGETAGSAGGQPPIQINSSKITQSQPPKKSPIVHSKSSVAVPVIQTKNNLVSSKNSSSKSSPKSRDSGNTKPSSKHPHQANFGEYDESEEWGVNVGHLIIDLDADIAQADKGKTDCNQSASMNASEEKPNLKMKIKRTKPPTKTSEAKHVIVKSDAPTSNGAHGTPTSVTHHNGASVKTETGTPRTPVLPRSSGYKKEKRKLEVNGVSSPTNGPSSPENRPSGRTDSEQPTPTENSPSKPKEDDLEPSSPAGKRQKLNDVAEKKDVCVGTSVGTITEPDILGPCEPGSAVTLEGIVWHETDTGILVLNVTWRGKTYVGTLLDCTLHDFAPPRFCDSPVGEVDTRTPKGRGKRGRTANNPVVAESSVAETRSVKLRNAAKGRRGVSTSTLVNNAPSSPAKSETGGIKRKLAKDAEISSDSQKTHKKPKHNLNKSSQGSPCSSPISDGHTSDKETIETQPSTPSQRPVSPKMIECSEPNCNKKYTHVNGLKYHQAHAHRTTNDTNKENCTPDKAPRPGDPDVKPDATNISKICNGSEKDVSEKDLLGHSLSPLEAMSCNTEEEESPSKTLKEIKNENAAEPNTPERIRELKRSIGTSQLPGSPLVHTTVSRNNLITGPQNSVSHVTAQSNISPVSPYSVSAEVDGSPKSVLFGSSDRSPNDQSNCDVIEPQVTSASLMPGINSVVEMTKALPTPLSLKEGDKEVSIGRSDIHSPAYSDISDANDSAPSDVILDSKDDKKIDLSLAGYNSSNYNLLYNSFSQPPPPYLLSSIAASNSPNMLKPDYLVDVKDKLIDKDKKDSVPSAGDFMKLSSSSYLYPLSYYGGHYPDSYPRNDVLYKDAMEKAKHESKDGPHEDIDKGPTDLSKNSMHSSGSEKGANVKESRTDALSKDVIDRLPGLPLGEKRSLDPFIGVRYPGGPYDRVLLPPAPVDKHADSRHASVGKPPTPVPLTSPRLGPTPPSSAREEKLEKRPESSSEGIKATMEGTGPPPAPTSAPYYPPFVYPQHPFEHFRSPVGNSMAGFTSPYIPTHPSLGSLRYPSNLSNAPEDLSRGSSASNLLSASGLFSGAHKLAELQERAQKSPLPPPSSLMQSQFMRNSSPIAYSTSSSYHPGIHPSTPSPSMSSAPSVPATTFSSLHLPMAAQAALADRRNIPHPNLPESFTYLMPFSPQFPGKN